MWPALDSAGFHFLMLKRLFSSFTLLYIRCSEGVQQAPKKRNYTQLVRSAFTLARFPCQRFEDISCLWPCHLLQILTDMNDIFDKSRIFAEKNGFCERCKAWAGRWRRFMSAIYRLLRHSQ
mmetsp:Transcript_57231/g.119664  ORF Transcript_57231/g.119664 Transcript_57231/m.119664 type:complete len:121 (+) Transcript_57231:565-927(+)